MGKKIKIERITCSCGEVIAGCVHGQQDASWESDKNGYIQSGCTSDIVDVENFRFGKCQCEGQKTKMRFKVLSLKQPQKTLFNQ